MSLGWTIVCLVVSVVFMFLNYLNYYVYIDMNDLDKTISEKIFKKGQVNGVIITIMFCLVMYLFKLTGLTI
jgi:cell division protein FtsL